MIYPVPMRELFKMIRAEWRQPLPYQTRAEIYGLFAHATERLSDDEVEAILKRRCRTFYRQAQGNGSKP